MKQNDPSRAAAQHACPACGAASIGGRQKWFASEGRPATCGACGAGCAVAATTSSGIVVMGALVATASGFAAAALRSPWVWLAGTLATVAVMAWRWRAAPLVQVSRAGPQHVVAATTLELAVWAALGFLLS